MTIRFLADENFNRRIVAGLQRHTERLDIVRVQDVGLRTADDPTVLDWAAAEGRVLLTHDIVTIPDLAYERILAGAAMPGVVVVPAALAIGVAIDELTMIATASAEGEWEGRVTYLPLR
jgi:predicted nuclease of predicted toxin-antitoxin system